MGPGGSMAPALQRLGRQPFSVSLNSIVKRHRSLPKRASSYPETRVMPSDLSMIAAHFLLHRSLTYAYVSI